MWRNYAKIRNYALNSAINSIRVPLIICTTEGRFSWLFGSILGSVRVYFSLYQRNGLINNCNSILQQCQLSFVYIPRKKNSSRETSCFNAIAINSYLHGNIKACFSRKWIRSIVRALCSNIRFANVKSFNSWNIRCILNRNNKKKKHSTLHSFNHNKYSVFSSCMWKLKITIMSMKPMSNVYPLSIKY